MLVMVGKSLTTKEYLLISTCTFEKTKHSKDDPLLYFLWLFIFKRKLEISSSQI
jgi:hypothetical protein